MKVQSWVLAGVMGNNFNLICPINVEAASNLSHNQSRSAARPGGSKGINPVRVMNTHEQPLTILSF